MTTEKTPSADSPNDTTTGTTVANPPLEAKQQIANAANADPARPQTTATPKLVDLTLGIVTVDSGGSQSTLYTLQDVVDAIAAGRVTKRDTDKPRRDDVEFARRQEEEAARRGDPSLRLRDDREAERLAALPPTGIDASKHDASAADTVKHGHSKSHR
jgi:hypothetical protein